MHLRITRAVTAALTVQVAACTSGQGSVATPTSNAAASGPAHEASPSPDADVLEGWFEVGGHELYLRCSGTGSPTVVYLHGSIPDPLFVGSSSALPIQDLVDEDRRMCVYDRANTGLSDPVEGPLDGRSSVSDLRGLLETAGVEPRMCSSRLRSGA